MSTQRYERTLNPPKKPILSRFWGWLTTNFGGSYTGVRNWLVIPLVAFTCVLFLGPLGPLLPLAVVTGLFITGITITLIGLVGALAAAIVAAIHTYPEYKALREKNEPVASNFISYLLFDLFAEWIVNNKITALLLGAFLAIMLIKAIPVLIAGPGIIPVLLLVGSQLGINLQIANMAMNIMMLFNSLVFLDVLCRVGNAVLMKLQNWQQHPGNSPRDTTADTSSRKNFGSTSKTHNKNLNLRGAYKNDLPTRQRKAEAPAIPLSANTILTCTPIDDKNMTCYAHRGDGSILVTTPLKSTPISVASPNQSRYFLIFYNLQDTRYYFLNVSKDSQKTYEQSLDDIMQGANINQKIANSRALIINFEKTASPEEIKHPLIESVKTVDSSGKVSIDKVEFSIETNSAKVLLPNGYETEYKLFDAPPKVENKM